MIAEQEQSERRAVVQSALASQRIEGLEPDPQAVADAQRWARGEMTLGAAVEQYKARMQLEMAGIGVRFQLFQAGRISRSNSGCRSSS